MRYLIVEEATRREALTLRAVEGLGQLSAQDAVDKCRMLNALAPEGIAYRVIPDRECELRIVCAWCRRVMQDGPGDRVSHGACKDCLERLT